MNSLNGQEKEQEIMTQKEAGTSNGEKLCHMHVRVADTPRAPHNRHTHSADSRPFNHKHDISGVYILFWN